jgi:hypothetical protein
MVSEVSVHGHLVHCCGPVGEAEHHSRKAGMEQSCLFKVAGKQRVGNSKGPGQEITPSGHDPNDLLCITN